MRNIFLFLTLVLVASCTGTKQSSPKGKMINGMEFVSMTLPNKLEVLLVHDTRFKKSSAALAVGIGSLEDPVEHQGMAHYLEHMLFLGTKEFPVPDEYFKYMSSNGGYANAYTADEVTDFFFEVDNAAIEGGLQRFSRFFVSPLFDAKYVDREKNAVNSEHEKNLKSDGWRIQHLVGALSKPGHPYGKFSTGSLKTLGDVKREEVLDFYSKHYSANNMKLVIMSAQPLDNMETWAKKYFSDVPNHDFKRPKYDDNFFNPDDQNRLKFVKSIEDSEDISVIFNIPDDRGYWNSKPVEILSGLIGSEAKNSLLSYLISKGWALKLSAGQSYWRSFSVDMTLTPAGRKNYDKVISAVFQYIDLVKTKGYPEYFFKDMQAIRRIDLDNLEPSGSGNRSAWFASQMIDYPVDEFLERNFLIKDYSKADFDKFLSYLKPDNAEILVSSKNEKGTKTEPVYGIHYSEQPLKVASVNDATFEYPAENKYVPTDFSLVARNVLGEPKTIDLKDKGEIFFRQDTELGLAKGQIHVQILSAIDNTPMNDLLNALYQRSKSEELREWGYPIGQARYFYWLEEHFGDEIHLNVLGYTQRLNEVLKDVIATKEGGRNLSTLSIDEKTFQDVKAKYKKDLQNIDEAMAAQRLGMEWDNLADSKGLRWQEGLKLIDKVKLKDVQDFAKKFYSKINVKMVAYGNVKEDAYPEIVDYIYSSLGATPMGAAAAEAKSSQFRIVPDGKNYSMMIKGKNNNNAILSYYKMSDWSVDDHAKTMILNRIVSQPYFTELRTNQQLGYIAHGSGVWTEGFIGVEGMLQSGKYSAKELAEKSDKFLSGFMKDQTEKMTEVDLQPIKAALVNELLTKPNTMNERYSIFRNQAFLYHGQFNIRQELADKIKATKAEDMKGFIKAKFIDHEPARITLYYLGDGAKMGKKDLPGTVFEKPDEIKDWVVNDPYKMTTVK